MLRSMTGYGSSERTSDERRVRVEVRSVNQRFLDLQIKAPRTMLQVEDRIRSLVESTLSRGRVSIYVEWKSAADSSSAINIPVAHDLIKELRRLGEDLSVPGEINLSILTRFPQIFEQNGESEGADEVWGALGPVVEEALAGLVGMRESEGARLADELKGRLVAIEGLVGTIEDAAPGASAKMKERLLGRLQSLLDGSIPVDDVRLAQEVAIASEKTDFTEEVVRLRAHISQARECFTSDEPVGKRFNFLVQEMHREANTIGSKGGDVGITGPVLSLKEEIEKLREQVQNVE